MSLLDGLARRVMHFLEARDADFSAQALRDENMRALERIREILADNALTDFECVEKIVIVMESLGLDGGDRHDFG